MVDLAMFGEPRFSCMRITRIAIDVEQEQPSGGHASFELHSLELQKIDGVTTSVIQGHFGTA